MNNPSIIRTINNKFKQRKNKNIIEESKTMDINVKKSIGAIYFFKNRNYETSDIVLKSSRNNNILNLTNLTNGGKKNNYSYIETKANLNKTINGTIPNLI